MIEKYFAFNLIHKNQVGLHINVQKEDLAVTLLFAPNLSLREFRPKGFN